MFKKFMAKLGVGSAKIDFVLAKPQYEIGETVEGEFRLEGGQVEQKINRIDVDLRVKLKMKDTHFTHTVASVPISGPFVLQPGERKTFSFSLQLPANLPISRSGVSYEFATQLDIADGLDSHDADRVQILPPVRFQNILRAFDLLGFQEKYDSGAFKGHSQEFEFAVTGPLRSRLNELEFEAALDENGIRLLLELDMPSLFGFSEKELKREIFLSNELLADTRQLADHLQAIIEDTLNNAAKYPATHYYHAHGYSRSANGFKKGGLPGALGAFVVGAVGAVALSSLLDGIEDVLDSVEDLADGGDDGGGFDD